MADDHLQDRAVAATFIFRFPNDDVTQRPRIALFRRSDKVRTYPHKYAPVSGSIESSDSSPLATALRELQEETGLSPPSIRLFRTGKPYSFADHSIKRRWTINPFAFLITSAAGPIQIDWEHESFAWFDPAEVVDGDAFVPRLHESFRRVWFDGDLGADAGAALTRGLRVLETDHESGARQLASRALYVLIDVVSRLDSTSRSRWWRNVRSAGWHLWKNGRESMGASILSVVLTSLSIIEARLPPDSADPLPTSFVDDILAGIKHFSEERQDVSSRIASSFRTFLDETFPAAQTLRILTLSYSSTICTCLQHLAQPDTPTLDIRVLESRPLFEGVALARSIADTIALNTPDSASRVTVFTDACAAVAAQDIDLVLIGADLIDRHGRVSNKTGSLPAVLAARHVAPDAKVVALADTDKVLGFDPAADGGEENDPRELVEAWGHARRSPGRIAVRNVYFEWVPQGLVDRYVTEEGVLSTEGIERWADAGRKRAEGFFADL